MKVTPKSKFAPNSYMLRKCETTYRKDVLCNLLKGTSMYNLKKNINNDGTSNHTAEDWNDLTEKPVTKSVQNIWERLQAKTGGHL